MTSGLEKASNRLPTVLGFPARQNYSQRGKDFRLSVEWRILGQVTQVLAQGVWGRRRVGWGQMAWTSQHISSSLCFFDASCLFKGYPPSCEAARVECSASSLQITDAARWAEGTASPVRACSGRACSACYANTVCAHVAVRGPGSDPNIRCKW